MAMPLDGTIKSVIMPHPSFNSTIRIEHLKGTGSENANYHWLLSYNDIIKKA